MRILPVLDLLNGLVVRGVAGRRHDYRPIVSRLASSPAPLDVAEAFARHFGLRDLYLADLDAIAGSPQAWPTYVALRGAGFHLQVDAGVRDLRSAPGLREAGVEVVVGLETVAGPQALGEIVRALGERLVFSLDLRDGAPLRERGWREADAWSIASGAVALGVRRLLVLDLARVGVGGGTGTEALCARLAATFPEVEVSAGGGVRGLADLQRLAAAGVRAALVASALHDGTLTRADLALIGDAGS